MEDRKIMLQDMTAGYTCCSACEMCKKEQNDFGFTHKYCIEDLDPTKCDIARSVAKGILSKKYLKLRDDEIVISKEEYNNLKSKQRTEAPEWKKPTKNETATEILSSFAMLYITLKATKIGLIQDPNPTIISDGALLFIEKYIKEQAEKYKIKTDIIPTITENRKANKIKQNQEN